MRHLFIFRHFCAFQFQKHSRSAILLSNRSAPQSLTKAMNMPPASSACAGRRHAVHLDHNIMFFLKRFRQAAEIGLSYRKARL